MNEHDKGVNYKYLTDHEKFIVRTQHMSLTVSKVEHSETFGITEEDRQALKELFDMLVGQGVFTREETDEALAKK